MELTRAEIDGPPAAELRALPEHGARDPRTRPVLAEPDPTLVAFAASRVGFDVPEVCWDDDSPCPLLEAALRAGGPRGRAVQLVVLDGRIVDPTRIEGLLGQQIPPGTMLAAARLAAAVGAEGSLLGIDVVVDGDTWWFGGMSLLPELDLAAVTSPRREPAAAS